MAGVKKIAPISTYSHNIIAPIRSQPYSSATEYDYDDNTSEAFESDDSSQEKKSQEKTSSEPLHDSFYSDIHRFKAALDDLFDNPESQDSLSFEMATAYAETLSSSINHLIEMGETCDLKKNTHFFFLIESVVYAFEPDLQKIGITYNRKRADSNAQTFFTQLSNAPQRLIFLTEANGFIDLLLRIHEGLNANLNVNQPEGSIIDFKG